MSLKNFGSSIMFSKIRSLAVLKKMMMKAVEEDYQRKKIKKEMLGSDSETKMEMMSRKILK